MVLGGWQNSPFPLDLTGTWPGACQNLTENFGNCKIFWISPLRFLGAISDFSVTVVHWMAGW